MHPVIRHNNITTKISVCYGKPLSILFFLVSAKILMANNKASLAVCITIFFIQPRAMVAERHAVWFGH